MTDKPGYKATLGTLSAVERLDDCQVARGHREGTENSLSSLPSIGSSDVSQSC